MRRILLVALSCLSAGLISVGDAAQAVDYRVLAYRGQLAPGIVAGGEQEHLLPRFGFLDEMTFSMNSAGHVAFGAPLDTLETSICGWLVNRTGIWLDTGDGPQLIRVAVDPAPEISAETGVGYLDNPVLDDRGNLTYYGPVTGGVPYCVEEVTWMRTGGVDFPLAIGDVTVALPPDVRVTRNVRSAFGAPAANGRVVLYSDTIDSVGADLGSVLMLAEPGQNPRVITRSDVPVPGSGAVRFDSLSTAWVSLNDHGQTAFEVGLVGMPPSLGPNGAVWRTDATGNVQAVAILDNVPAEVLGERFSYVDEYQVPRIDNAGDIMFYAERGAQNGYWLGRAGGGVEAYHVTGEPLADLPAGSTLVIANHALCPSGSSSLCRPFDRSPEGQAAFVAEADLTSSGGGVAPGVWRDLGSGLHLAALAGQQAPGYPLGTTFAEFRELDIDAQGRLAFVARVTGLGVTDATAHGVWVLPPSGSLEFFATLQGPGAEIDVGLSDPSVVGGFLQIRVSASGKAAYLVTFDNGYEGLLLAVPEPATWMLAAMGGAFAMVGVRRHARRDRSALRR